MSSPGNRIKNLRKQKGWKQKELGQKLDVSPQVISNWERDYSAPDHKDLTTLAKIFGTTTDYLLGRIDDIFNTQINDATNVELLIGDFNKANKNSNHNTFDLVKLFNSSYGISINNKTLAQDERKSLIGLLELFHESMITIKNNR